MKTQLQIEIDDFVKEWADKIDEAKAREAYGDLSMIAYELLNRCVRYYAGIYQNATKRLP